MILVFLPRNRWEVVLSALHDFLNGEELRDRYLEINWLERQERRLELQLLEEKFRQWWTVVLWILAATSIAILVPSLSHYV